VRALLVRPHQPRIARDIGGKDGGKTAGSGHFVAPSDCLDRAYAETDRDPSLTSRSSQMVEFKFAYDSLLEEAVRSELVSGAKIPC
jgi:hypothetical protein